MNKRAKRRLKEAIEKEKQERVQSQPKPQPAIAKDPQQQRGFLLLRRLKPCMDVLLGTLLNSFKYYRVIVNDVTISADTAMTTTDASATIEAAMAITGEVTATTGVAQGLQVIRFLVLAVGSGVDTMKTSL